MTDIVNTTIEILMKNSEFKNKLEVHLNNIMKDGKITTQDLPDLVLFLVECYNNLSNKKLSLSNIPDFLRYLVKRILNENDIVPDEQKESLLNLLEVAIKLVMIQPKVKKCCLNFFKN